MTPDDAHPPKKYRLSLSRSCLIGFLVLSGIAGTVSLRVRSVSAQATETAKKQRTVKWNSDQASVINATGVQTLKGNVKFISDETVMRTALAMFNDRTKIAVAPGTIQIDDQRNTLIGNKGTAYYNSRKAIIEGAVKIVVRPKKGGESAPKGSARREFKDPVTINCDRVEYYWKNRIAVGTGNLTLRQNTSEGVVRTATAKRLIFYANEERLVLDGEVNAVDSKGQKLKGPLATAIIREGAEQFNMERGAEGVLILEDEDEPDPSPTPLLPAPLTIPAATPTPVTPPVPTPIPKVTPTP